MDQDFYRALDLPPSASAAEVRAAYNRILRQVAARAGQHDPADLARLERARDAYRALLSAMA
ncbi:MAG: hypothetical protein HYU78_07090 [Rhodocyclales bacterium]|nr:hypothetical protein [Rhodocyclales bacterium]